MMGWKDGSFGKVNGRVWQSKRKTKGQKGKGKRKGKGKGKVADENEGWGGER